MASNCFGAGVPPSDVFTADSPQVARPKNRWEEIRAANARSAGYVSSWDTIRQRYERHQSPSSMSSQSNGSPSSDTDDRAIEQAKFDAILDAERRRGHEGDTRDFV